MPPAVGLHVSYTTLERFVWRLGYRPRGGRRGDTVRLAPTPPGEVAEMDFERLLRLDHARERACLCRCAHRQYQLPPFKRRKRCSTTV